MVPSSGKGNRLVHRGWRNQLLSGSIIIGFAMLCNIIMLILSAPQGHVGGDPNSQVLYRGDCSYILKLSTVIHVAINIISTLLLAASNSAVQVLTAPTREHIDIAHSSGRSLQIGCLSISNLRYYSWDFKLVAVLLAFSSMPLHYIYNATVYPELGVMQYLAVVVNDHFFDPSTDLTTLLSDPQALTWYEPVDKVVNSLIQTQLHQANGTLSHLTWPECAAEFKKGLLSYNKAIILPTAYQNRSHPVLNVEVESIDVHSADAIWNTADYWLCNGDSPYETFPKCQDPGFALIRVNDPVSTNYDTTQIEVTVSSCYVLQDEQRCSLNLNIGMMVTVIVCNIIKLGGVLYILRSRKEPPMLTVGDTISYFLSYDSDKSSIPLLPTELNIEPNSETRNSRSRLIRFISQRRLSTIGLPRWGLTLMLCLTGWITALCFVIIYGSKAVSRWDLLNRANNLVVDWKDSGDFYNSSDFYNSNLSSLLLVANLPQFIVSYVYLIYNDSFTVMQTAVELARFASYPYGKTLRVSDPVKGQRSNYFLQLPYRYTIPFITTMAVLHWLLSEMFVVTNVRVYMWPQDTQDTASGASVPFLSWNAAAGIYSLIVSGFLIMMYVLLGLRKIPTGMPTVSTQSRALHTLCSRRSDFEGPEIIHERLKYGILMPPTTRSLFVGFTARVEEVQPLNAFPILEVSDGYEAGTTVETIPLSNIAEGNRH